MSNRIVSIAMFAALVFATARESAAQAGGPMKLYGGVSSGFVTIDTNQGADDGSLLALNGRLGLYFNEYFSVELRPGLGLTDYEETAYSETETILGIDVTFTGIDTIELNSTIGLYGRLAVLLDSPFMPYVAFGVNRISITETARATATAVGLDLSEAFEGISEDFTDTSLSFGFGVDWILRQAQGLRLNAEYTFNEFEFEYNSEDYEYDINSFSVGFTYDF